MRCRRRVAITEVMGKTKIQKRNCGLGLQFKITPEPVDIQNNIACGQRLKRRSEPENREDLEAICFSISEGSSGLPCLVHLAKFRYEGEAFVVSLVQEKSSEQCSLLEIWVPPKRHPLVHSTPDLANVNARESMTDPQ